ncbi:MULTISPECIES: transcriptional regulator FtsR [Oerskovia]|uniref:MerR family transcriptional regulator n=2 Tax=Oerskovia TaxID=162491 RepID=A0ABW1XF32_9CELL|nr:MULTISPECIES: MerR family transcriptional regulator [Oerskovia]MBM7497440.1 DNA-binding transcriptional MerR regulator [Oerskovia paurometabola]
MNRPARSPWGHENRFDGSSALTPRPADEGDVEQPGEPWPQGISRRASMRISDVLRALRTEFPGVSHSKLRFLEEQGLIDPERTPSGYRQYSPADVERLRYVLLEQRDRYLPLKVIKENLAALDAGEVVENPALRLAASDGETETTAARQRYTVGSLATTVGVDVSLVEGLISAGVLRQAPGGQLDAWSLEVVQLAAALGEYGIEPRHLRLLRTSADRHVGLVEQVVAPWRSQQSSSARAHAGALAGEVGELFAKLHTVWLRQGVGDLTN